MGYSSDGATFSAPAGDTAIPEAALLMRNIVLGAEFIMSHITHFYHLAALDYVAGPPMPPWTPYFGPTTGSDAYIYYRNQWGHALTAPGFTYSAINLTNASGGTAELNSGTTVWSKIILDYIEALHMRRAALEAGAIFSGGLPMFRSLVPGGLTYRPTTGDVASARSLLFGTGTFANPAPGSVVSFVKNHLIPITDIVAAFWSNRLDNKANWYWNRVTDTDPRGPGGGWGNYLAWGTFPQAGATPAGAITDVAENARRLLKRGKWITDGATLTTNTAAGAGDAMLWASEDKVREFTTWSKYTAASGPESTGLHPSGGVTDPSTVTKHTHTPYTWAKAPRYLDAGGTLTDDYHPMEVGPLARMIICGEREGVSTDKWKNYKLNTTKGTDALNHHTLGELAHTYLVAIGADLSKVTLYTCGASVMDRHRARALEAAKIAEAMEVWLSDLDGHIVAGDGGVNAPVTTRALPSSGVGYGTHEAPRGALAHWVMPGANAKVSNYQCVVPTTWNMAPKHDHGGAIPGPIEAAVGGYPVTTGATFRGIAAPYLESAPTLGSTTGGRDVPLDVERVIHSFDPCIACTVHVVDAAGNKNVVDIDDAKPMEVEEAIARNVHERAKKEVSRR